VFTVLRTWLCLGLMGLMLSACSSGDNTAEGAEVDAMEGRVRIDGSSTVFLLSEAVAEDFQIENPGVRVTVAVSGSGGGFQRFCAGETDLSNASRPISSAEEEQCRDEGVEYLPLTVGWDGISVVANAGNDFARCLTVEELERIWRPTSDIRTWRDVRRGWPDEEIRLYGPGTDSGTFDFFTEVITGRKGASRPDFQASEDDNILVRGVAGDPYALGYFGYAYFKENEDRLRLLAVDAGQGCVRPSDESIEDGSYSALARPLFVYVRTSALARPEVRAYLDFLLENGSELVRSTGYYALSEADYEALRAQVREAARASAGAAG